MNDTKIESFLIEAVALSEEIMRHGSNKGRGVRLAAVVLKINEAMINGNTPISWSPPSSKEEISKLLFFPRPGKLPTDDTPTVIPKAMSKINQADKLFNSEEVEYLDGKWDDIREEE